MAPGSWCLAALLRTALSCLAAAGLATFRRSAAAVGAGGRGGGGEVAGAAEAWIGGAMGAQWERLDSWTLVFVGIWSRNLNILVKKFAEPVGWTDIY